MDWNFRTESALGSVGYALLGVLVFFSVLAGIVGIYLLAGALIALCWNHGAGPMLDSAKVITSKQAAGSLFILSVLVGVARGLFARSAK